MTLDYKFGHAGAKLTPEYLKSIDNPTGAALTVGAIKRLSDASAAAKEALRESNAAFAKKAAVIMQKLDALRRDLDALEKRHAPPRPAVTPAPGGRW
jgi:hypothetical protein